MDSPQVREGATLYIPVFQPGALLYFGDGHAQQGEGELPGQGLETSLDVQLTVNLVQNKALAQPRLENADYVMIMGNGVTVGRRHEKRHHRDEPLAGRHLWPDAAGHRGVPGNSDGV